MEFNYNFKLFVRMISSPIEYELDRSVEVESIRAFKFLYQEA